MSIFKRFRGLTATGIAPLVVMSLATPLAFAQNANERYSGVASVSDVDGNGYGDHAVVKWHPGKKKYFVYITDGFTGNYIDKYSFGSVPVQGILGIEDVNGNKQREIAVLRVNKKGKTFVRVRDAASGEDLSDSFVAGGVQKPKAMAVVSDISGNEGQEYAVLFTNKNTTASQVRIRDARTGRFVSNVEVFDGRIRAQALGVLPSIDVNDNDEIAVMGTDTRNGQVRVRLIDSLTGQSINDVIFITGSGRRAQGMTILSDLNENGSSEISVLYVRKDDGSIRVLTKDAQTGADISDHEYFGEDFTPLGITTVKNLDGPESGFDGIAVMAKRANGEVRVRVRLPDSGRQLALTTYHDRRYTTQQMLQLADLDEDGVGDMGVMFTNKSTGTARVRIRNPITRANLINTQIVGGDGNIPPIALAGEDVAVTRGFAVSLDGTDSFDVDTNKSLKYEWKQVSGPDVTGGRGSLRGKRPLFAAPRDVRSVVMKLVVTDSGGLVGEEPIVVNALEDADRAFFVDGDNGSDSTGDGTRENPFASPYNALNAATDRQDIYVMTRRDGQRYNEGRSYWFARRGVSLYGGYDKNWVRDRVGNKTSMLNTSTREFGLYMDEVSEDTWVSGFRIQHSPSNTTNVYGIIAGEGGDAHLYIEDNVVSTSSGRTTDGTTPPGSAYGIWGCYLRNITIRDNEVRPGAGGWANGRRSNYGEAAANGDDGSNGSATTGGDGGSGTPGYNGGGGGNAGTGAGSNGGGGGTGNAPSGSSGGSGGAGGSGNTSDNGSVGGGGRGGNGGNGGNGFTGSHEINSCGLYVIDAGSQGGGGVAGYGGGGGGGGEATISGVNGGGGGGGGEGGAPGAGGLGGYNGGASIGIAVGNADGVTIERNQVVANRGGRGGSGGLGQPSGVGGTGGNGASGNSGVGTGGNGGHGGGGGRGGFGGMGGGGAGGPSYGIVLGNISAEQLRDNNITVSAGGPGSISGGAPGIGGTSGAGGGTGGAGGGGVTPERNGTPAANGNGRTGDSAPTRDWQSQ